jgi:hypothetical protein
VWLVTALGYGGGTFGQCKLIVYSDDGSDRHFPSSNVLGQANPVVPVQGPDRPISFLAPIAVTAGQIIHFVFSNTDATPNTNFYSLDCLYDYLDNVGQPPDRPVAIPLYDLDVIPWTGAAWDAHENGRDHFRAIIDVMMGDGSHFGNGYMESGSTAAGSTNNGFHIVNGANRVRETFTVSGGDKVVDALWVHLFRTGGTAPLTITLAHGTVIDCSIAMPASGFAVGGHGITPNDSSQVGNPVWYDVPIPTLTLADGTAYTLTLTTEAGTTYTIPVSRDGKAATYAYGAQTVFNDGHAQYSINGVDWVNWDTWGVPSVDQDMEFFFRIAESVAAVPTAGVRAYDTLVNLKAELGIGAGVTTYDALLTSYLVEATAFIETYTGRVFQAVLATRDYAPTDDSSFVYTDEFVSVTAVTTSKDGTWGSPTTLTEGVDFMAFTPNSRPPFRGLMGMPSAAGRFPVVGVGSYKMTVPSVRVTAMFGYSTTPPADIQLVCRRLATRSYKLPGAPFGVLESAGSDTYPIRIVPDKDVQMRLDNYKRPLFR